MHPLDEAWHHWLGQGVVTLDTPDRDALARRLFDPPSENFHGEPKAFRVADVDRNFVELARRRGLKPKPFWPEGQPYAVCLTHDIDRILSTIHGLKQIRREGLRAVARIGRDLATAAVASERHRNPFFNFRELQAWEAEQGVRSASYVLFEKRRWGRALFSGEWQHAIGVYQPKTILKELVAYEARGNEVGVHGSFDSWGSADALKQDAAELREAGIASIVGVRNHYLQFDAERTFDAQAGAGIAYDSTMGFNYRSGFRCGTCFPYRWRGQWELPFQLMDSALRYQHSDPHERLAEADSVLREVSAMGGVLVVNWHLHVMNPESFPTEMDLLEKIITRARHDGAWFALPREVISWWERRIEGG